MKEECPKQKVYKINNNYNNSMLPSDPRGSPDESFFIFYSQYLKINKVYDVKLSKQKI